MRGEVLIEAKEAVRFNCIYFTFTGLEKVLWTLFGVTEKRTRELINREHALIDTNDKLLKPGLH